MSIIRLTGIAAYAFAAKGRGNAEAEVTTFFGAESAVRQTKTGLVVLEMGSVPLGGITKSDQTAPSPKGGMFLLYGHRDRLNEIERRSVWAEERGLKFVIREIEVDVQNVVQGITSEKHLAQTEFALLMRMEAALQKSVRDQVIDLLQADLEKTATAQKRKQSIIDDAMQMPRDQLFGRHSDIVVRVIEEDERFNNLSVVVIPIDDEELRQEGKPSIRNVAYLRKGAKIVGEVGETSPDDREELRLPRRLRPKP